MGILRLISELRADRKIKKLLRDAPQRSIADVRENRFVRVEGDVQPHHARVLEAPLSGRLCVYYSITVTARATGLVTLTRRPMEVIGDEHEGMPFELDDGASRALIDPADAWISSRFDHHSRGFDERERALYVRLGLHRTRRPYANLTFQEAVLAVGERIVVFGAGVLEPERVVDPEVETGYREGAGMRLRFTGTAKFPLVIRDD